MLETQINRSQSASIHLPPMLAEDEAEAGDDIFLKFFVAFDNVMWTVIYVLIFIYVMIHQLCCMLFTF